MPSRNYVRSLLVSSVAVAGLCASMPDTARAQASAAATDGTSLYEDIVVTARKREETSIAVPVVVSAVGARELERRGISNLDAVARVVPQLLIGNSGGSTQGGLVVIRGIAGGENNAFQDQAVAFNIDGVQVAKSSIRRMSSTDIAQIEVLKGPQALFFGKNSPGGIISIRTADPTDSFEAKLAGGYEFEGREWRTEGYVSGPASDTLGWRVAGYFSDMDGFLKSEVPQNSPFYQDKRAGAARDYSVRGTLKWEPDSNFSARLKLNYGDHKDDGITSTREWIYCPLGARQSGSGGQCAVGDHVRNTGNGPVVGTIPATFNLFGNGDAYTKQKQFLGSLEMNYDFSDDVTLTSVTGYYDNKTSLCANFSADDYGILASCQKFSSQEFSQELRIATSYDGPLNFVAGGYFANTETDYGSLTYFFKQFGQAFPFGGGINNPVQLAHVYFLQKGLAASAFGQLSYKPVDVVEITVGGRYSYERKKLPMVKTGRGLADGGPAALPGGKFLDASTIVDLTIDERTYNDFSPEITLSYRPTEKLTLFGSYKRGFISGGFNAGAFVVSNDPDLSYEPQTVKGFEGGVKALLLDDMLRVNLSAYTYKISQQQVTSFFNTVQTITNAASSTVKGAELDFSFRPPISGLELHGAASYNRARYKSFIAPCYAGQSIAEGCDLFFNPAANNGLGGFTQQDLSGARLPRAPKWNLSAGFNYETPVATGFRIGLSGDVNYTSNFDADPINRPSGIQKSYTLIDGTIRLMPENDNWEIAFIGRNLTNKHYYLTSGQAPFISGGRTGRADAIPADQYASVNRGRELWLRATIKFH